MKFLDTFSPRWNISLFHYRGQGETGANVLVGIQVAKSEMEEFIYRADSLGYNFDHPDAFDTEKLLDSMDNLRHGRAVDIPNYDFKSYKTNVFPARRVNPSDVIILEGILIFHDPHVQELMNMKIFVDTGYLIELLSLLFG